MCAKLCAIAIAIVIVLETVLAIVVLVVVVTIAIALLVVRGVCECIFFAQHSTGLLLKMFLLYR